MSVTYYRHDDASAPVLDGTVNSLVEVLDACLVTGYGAKVAAGWTKPYTGTNKAAFRMATGAGKNGHYLRVRDTGDITTDTARSASVIGYRTMSDVDTGTGAFPLVPSQVAAGFQGLHYTKSATLDTTARPWLIVADDTFFIMYSWSNSTVFSQVATSGSRQATMMFGQIDAEYAGDTNHTFIDCRNSSTYTDTSTYTEGSRQVGNASTTTNARRFLAKDVLGIADSAPANLASATYYSNTTPVGYSQFPNIVTGEIHALRTLVVEKDPYGSYSFVRGVLPFMRDIEQLAPNVDTSVTSLVTRFDEVAGGGDDAGKTFIVIPQYVSGTPYATLVQIVGSR